MAWISDPEAWIALATLTLLEIVLGIDNIVFISILSERVEASKRALARQVGLGLAMVKKIVDEHGARVEAVNRNVGGGVGHAGGAVVTIVFRRLAANDEATSRHAA